MGNACDKTRYFCYNPYPEWDIFVTKPISLMWTEIMTKHTIMLSVIAKLAYHV